MKSKKLTSQRTEDTETYMQLKKHITVLHIGPMPPQIGGMESYMGALLNSSLVERFSIFILNIAKPRLQESGHYAIKTGYRGAFKRPLTVLLTSYGYSLKFLTRYIRQLIRYPIHIVHIHTASYTSFWEKCLYILIGRVSGRKVVLHIHGAMFDEFYNNSRSRAKTVIIRFIKACHAVIVLSERWQEFFAPLVDENSLYVVENGIDLSPFETIRKKAEVKSFLHMGEISERKGVYDLVSMAVQLKSLGLSFHIDVVGPGEIDRLTQRIKECNVEEYITLHGPKQGADKYAFYDKADFFILASYAEGLPLALLEAMAAGLPVITTWVGGIPDVIVDGEHGFLCRPGDIDAFVKAVSKLLQDDTLAQTISRNNIKFVDKRFNIERCAEKISTIYRILGTDVA